MSLWTLYPCSNKNKSSTDGTEEWNTNIYSHVHKSFILTGATAKKPRSVILKEIQLFSPYHMKPWKSFLLWRSGCWQKHNSMIQNKKTLLKNQVMGKGGDVFTLVLWSIHRGRRAVVDSSARSWTHAASWRLESRGVAGQGGTPRPAAGTTALHPDVSTGEGGPVKSDWLVVRLLRRSVNYGHCSLLLIDKQKYNFI